MSLTVLLLVATPALAHVTVESSDPSPRVVSKYTVRVPNESEDAATVKVEVRLPKGIGTPSPKALTGWDVAIEDGILTISGGRIEPNDSRTFVFRAQNPSKAGDVTFPVIQTYEDGEEAQWIGDPGSDNPAPVVAISGKAPPPKKRPPRHDPTNAPAAPTEVDAAPTTSPGQAPATSSSGVLVAVVVVAMLGLGAAAAAVVRRGPRA